MPKINEAAILRRAKALWKQDGKTGLSSLLRCCRRGQRSGNLSSMKRAVESTWRARGTSWHARAAIASDARSGSPT